MSRSILWSVLMWKELVRNVRIRIPIGKEHSLFVMFVWLLSSAVLEVSLYERYESRGHIELRYLQWVSKLITPHSTNHLDCGMFIRSYHSRSCYTCSGVCGLPVRLINAQTHQSRLNIWIVTKPKYTLIFAMILKMITKFFRSFQISRSCPKICDEACIIRIPLYSFCIGFCLVYSLLLVLV